MNKYIFKTTESANQKQVRDVNIILLQRALVIGDKNGTSPVF